MKFRIPSYYTFVWRYDDGYENYRWYEPYGPYGSYLLLLALSISLHYTKRKIMFYDDMIWYHTTIIPIINYLRNKEAEVLKCWSYCHGFRSCCLRSVLWDVSESFGHSRSKCDFKLCVGEQWSYARTKSAAGKPIYHGRGSSPSNCCLSMSRSIPTPNVRSSFRGSVRGLRRESNQFAKRYDNTIYKNICEWPNTSAATCIFPFERKP